MADTNGTSYSVAWQGGSSANNSPGTAYGGRVPVTTYYYRTSAGASGSTTAVGSIPAGATVERTRTA